MRRLGLYRAERIRRLPQDDFAAWCRAHMPGMLWDVFWLVFVRKHLRRITDGEIDRLGIMVPPQHGKTTLIIAYIAWRILRTSGLRVALLSHSQTYAEKVSRQIKRVAESAGGVIGTVDRADEWVLSNGSSFIARGRGRGIAGESVDLCVIDDVFGSRIDADSPTIQERAYEWYMDDVWPRLQKDAAIILVNTRWGPGDLYGRIAQSPEFHRWEIVRLPAIAEENDPLGRAPGEALCPERFPLDKLLLKREVEQVGFESLFQGNPIPRGGTFFQRSWFTVLDKPPAGVGKLVRYWDLAASRHDTGCYTSGVLLGKFGTSENVSYCILDVVRGRWVPADRNEIILNTARADATRPGFEKTWFEKPVFDRDGAASRAIIAKLAGYPVQADNVSGQGSKELRAEPLAGAARGGLISVLAGPWTGAFLSEYEMFPQGMYLDQVDSGSGAFNKLTRPAGGAISINGQGV